MLFDLRGRGRRRTVQIVYLGLALIFLLGFVGFGVGVGGGGGGIFNALTENEGSNSASFAGKVAAAQKRTQRHPTEAAAWAALAEAQLHQASEPEYFNQISESEPYTAKGKLLLAKVAASWNKYLSLEPHHPNAELAQKILNIYAETGLNQPAEVIRAVKIVIAAEPTSATLPTLYRVLAENAYKANKVGVGDAATRKAISLTPGANRKQVKTYLAELRKNPLGHTPSKITQGPNGTYIATQAGKTYTVKKGPNGSFVGVTSATGKTPPAGHTSTSSTTKKK
ncbi:MAG: hypothetical protein ACHQE6_10880 [Solirubrobacterales bacterium]